MLFEAHSLERSADIAGPASVPKNLQALRNNSPHLAAGIAMGLLMGHASFANRTFGGIARLIAGHVNRGHYLIVFRDGRPTGFVGWAFAPEVAALAWLHGDGSLLDDGQDGRTGDCVVFNAWVTDGAEMNSFLVPLLRKEFHNKTALMARRLYPDGRVRPVLIRNNRL